MSDPNNDDHWGAQLPEDLSAHPLVTKYPSQEEFVRGFLNAQELIGRKGVIPPGQGAKPEEIEAFKASLDPHKDAIRAHLFPAPAGPEVYDLKDPENFPQDLAIDAQLLADYKTVAHKAGLSVDAAQTLYSWYQDTQATLHQAQQQRYAEFRQESEKALRQEYGKDYEAKLLLGKKALRVFGSPEFADYLDQSKLGDDARFLRFMIKLADLVGEAGVHGDVPPPEQRLTRERLREMMQDPRYSDPGRRDPDFVKRVQAGYEQLYGPQP